MEDVLRDPEARKQLREALVDRSKTVTVNGIEYQLVSWPY